MTEPMSASEELAFFDKVLLKLAMTDDDRLERLLHGLFVPVLKKIESPNAPTRAKVVEALTHINKRIGSDETIQLPVDALLALWQTLDAQKAGPTLRNFSLLYLSKAFKRAPNEKQWALLPSLLEQIASRDEATQKKLLQMAIPVFQYANLPPDIEERKSQWKFSQNADDVSVFTTACIPVLAGLSIMSTKPEETPVGPCMSPVEWKGVLSMVSPCTSAKQVEVKMGVLEFLKSGIFRANDILLPLIVAASDWSGKVGGTAQDALKRLSNLDLETAPLVQQLMSYYAGDSKQGRTPASPNIKTRIVNHLCKSVTATNKLPEVLTIMFDIMFDSASSMKIRLERVPFIQWAMLHSTGPNIKAMAPLLLNNGLVKLLDSLGSTQGDFVAGRNAEHLRAFCYTAIGTLSKRSPTLFADNLALVEKLFGRLTSEAPNVRISVQEGLSLLRPVFRDARETTKDAISVLLLTNIEHDEHHARFSAVQWANELFSRTNVEARYICLLGLADTKPEVKAEAEKGLGLLVSQRTFAKVRPDADEYPSLKSFLTYLGRQWATRVQKHEDHKYSSFRPAVYEGLFTYVEDVIQCEAQRDELSAAKVVQRCHESPADGLPSPIDSFHAIVSTVLEANATPLAHSSASSALLNLISRLPENFVDVYAGQNSVMSFILSSGAQPETRISFAKIQAWIVPKMNDTQLNELLSTLIRHCSGEGDDAASVKKLDRQHGAVTALGYVLARAVDAKLTLSQARWQEALFAIYQLCDHRDPPLACQAIASLGTVAQVAPWAIPEGDTAILTSLAAADTAADEPSPPSSSADLTATLILAKLFVLLRSDSHKIVERTAAALGLFAVGNPSPTYVDPIMTRLIRCGDFKHDEVQFCIGESLAYVGGAPVAADTLVEFETLFGDAVTGVLSRLQSQVTPERMDSVLDRLFGMLRKPQSANTRSSLCVWLLSVAKFGSPLPNVQRKLPDFQTAFSGFVSDNNEITQEVASRGLGLLYDLGDDNMKQELVKSLVDTLSGKKKAAAVTETADGTGELAKGVEFEAEDSTGHREKRSVSTYKELCTIANEMGKPDLIYRFLEIASTHAMWNSQRGAAFGFSTIASKAGDKLTPYLHGLVPKLFRYQFDPNKKIQAAMRQIWEVLVREPKKAIQQHFGEIMKELLKGLGDRMWRVREASCVGLSDVVQQRDINELEPYLLKAWEGMFRLLDDIKDSTRQAATAAAKQLGGMSVKLCDPARNGAKASERAVAIVIPALLDIGIADRAEEVRMLSVKYLAEVAKVAGALTRPHAVKLIPGLLENMSSLEPLQLSYAQMHTDKISMTAEQLENARIMAARSSPLADALEICLRHVGEEEITGVTPALVALVRQGLGLPTKGGICHVINTLCRTHAIEIKPSAGKLMKSLSSHINDRSATIRRQYCASISNLARYAPANVLGEIVAHTIRNYWDVENEKLRGVAPRLFRDLARNAADQLKDFDSEYLPVAYFGSFDWEPALKELWSEVWSDNPVGNSVGLKLYLNEVVTLIEAKLGSQSWKLRAQAARTLEDLAETIKSDIKSHVPALLELIASSFVGRTYDGKEALVSAAVAVCLAAPDLARSDANGLNALIPTLVQAATKSASSYRSRALQGLANLAKAFDDRPDILQASWDVIVKAIQDGMTGSGPADKDQAMTDRQLELLNEEKKEGIELRKSSFEAIGKIWPASVQEANHAMVLAMLPDVTRELCRALQTEVIALQMVVLKSVRQVLQKIQGASLSSGLGENEQREFINAVCRSVSDSNHAQLRIQALGALRDLIAVLKSSSSGAELLSSEVARIKKILSQERDARAQAEAALVLQDLQDVKGPADPMVQDS